MSPPVVRFAPPTATARNDAATRATPPTATATIGPGGSVRDASVAASKGPEQRCDARQASTAAAAVDANVEL